jgi:hypothetical protein
MGEAGLQTVGAGEVVPSGAGWDFRAISAHSYRTWTTSGALLAVQLSTDRAAVNRGWLGTFSRHSVSTEVNSFESQSMSHGRTARHDGDDTMRLLGGAVRV